MRASRSNCDRKEIEAEDAGSVQAGEEYHRRIIRENWR